MGSEKAENPHNLAHELPPDFAHILNAWPHLPDHIKAAAGMEAGVSLIRALTLNCERPLDRSTCPRLSTQTYAKTG